MTEFINNTDQIHEEFPALSPKTGIRVGNISHEPINELIAKGLLEREEEYRRIHPREHQAGDQEFVGQAVAVRNVTFQEEILKTVPLQTMFDVRDNIADRPDDVLSGIESSLPAEVKVGYEEFLKTLEDLPPAKLKYVLFSMEKALMVPPLGNVAEEIFEIKEQENRIKLKRAPSLSEYLMILWKFSSDAGRTEYDIGQELGGWLEELKNHMVDSDYLSAEEFDKRIQGIDVTVTDPLAMAVLSHGADHSTGLQYRNRVVIEADLADLKAVVIHELVHALSGRAMIKGKENGTAEKQLAAIMEGREEQPEEVTFEQRSGLGVNRPDGHKIFRWLNEAVTQEIENDIMGKKSKGYSDEVRLMNAILATGKAPIAFDTLAMAYFEDYDPDDPDRTRHWKRFIHEINKAFYPGFLTDLEKMLENHSIEKALKLMAHMN